MWIILGRYINCYSFAPFGAIQFHYSQEKADISTADVSRTLQFPQKQSGWMNITADERKDMFVFVLGWTFPFNLSCAMKAGIDFAIKALADQMKGEGL